MYWRRKGLVFDSGHDNPLFLQSLSMSLKAYWVLKNALTIHMV